MLGQNLAQDGLLGKVFGTYDNVGLLRVAAEQTHNNNRNKKDIYGAHQLCLCNRFCRSPNVKSAVSARTAAGIAPARMNWLSTMATPRKTNSPSPPAPMAAAIVATPTAITVATRMPARMVLMARGISTRHSS